MARNDSAPYRHVPMEEKKSGWDDYDLRNALETLTRANKIRRNKPLMAAVKAEAKKQLAAATARNAELTKEK